MAGWAANRGDGTVEAVFEGDAGRGRADASRSAATGPGHAHVERLDVADEEPEGLTRLRRRLSAGGRPHPFRRAPGVR